MDDVRNMLIFFMVNLLFAFTFADDPDISETPTSNKPLDPTIVIVLAVTFPCAFLVGILWCCCLNKCLGIHKKKLSPKSHPPVTSRQHSVATSQSSSQARYSIETSQTSSTHTRYSVDTD